MKKIIIALLVLVLSLSVLVSCSNNSYDYEEPSTETTTRLPDNVVKITITSRNAQELLGITYNKEKLALSEDFSSEKQFVISDSESEFLGAIFEMSFVSDVTARDDYSATLVDSSVVIKFTELEKITMGNGNLVYSYDESWYGEFKTRYYLYEINDDLIKISVKEQITDEALAFFFSLLEFENA